MVEEATAAEDFLMPDPLNEKDHQITIRRCRNSRRRLVPDGKSETLDLIQAVQRLAPSRTPLARRNVVKLRTGHFIGVDPQRGTNFVIINPTTDGDIRWLYQKHPEIGTKLKEVYLVEDVMIRRNTVDLPVQNPEAV